LATFMLQTPSLLGFLLVGFFFAIGLTISDLRKRPIQDEYICRPQCSG
jgi:uncharacterized protein YneF (UPF0154 family)